MQYFVHIIKY